MPTNSTAKDWINEVNMYINERNYDLVLFLLVNNNNMYQQLKKHSLCTKDYVSQVVKLEIHFDIYDKYNFKTKIIMNRICSKILLQIDAKLGGSTYKVELEKPLVGKRIMVIGVDSRRLRIENNNETLIALVSTINENLNDFYNETKIIREDDYNNRFYFCINDFIEESTKYYEKNNNGNKPDSLIIYRKGLTLEQKDILKKEMREIDIICRNKNIKYYYFS